MGIVATLLLLTPAQTPAGIREEALTYRAGKETVKAVRYAPAGKGPFPAVVVLHGDFGLTAWVKQQARRLAEKGYLALAVDRYDGELPKTIEDAHILDRGLEDERVIAAIKAAVDHLADNKDVRKAAIGV